MPWLLNEDAALKLKLQGLVVFDADSGSNGRPVPVRYRLPETEVADLTFPIIVISHNGWYYAPERDHRGYDILEYAPEGLAPWWNSTGNPSVDTFDPTQSPYLSYFPIPYNFDYQVTVYSRFMHEHTIPLVSALAGPDRLHPKFGYLDIPQDGTKRTLQLLGGPDLLTAKDTNDKRLFMANYTVRVFSELLPPINRPNLVNTVSLNLSVYVSTDDLTTADVQTSFGIISSGISTAWNTAQLNQ